MIWGNKEGRLNHLFSGILETGETQIVTKEVDNIETDDIIQNGSDKFRVESVTKSYWQGASVFRRAKLRPGV